MPMASSTRFLKPLLLAATLLVRVGALPVGSKTALAADATAALAQADAAASDEANLSLQEAFSRSDSELPAYMSDAGTKAKIAASSAIAAKLAEFAQFLKSEKGAEAYHQALIQAWTPEAVANITKLAAEETERAAEAKVDHAAAAAGTAYPIVTEAVQLAVADLVAAFNSGGLDGLAHEGVPLMQAIQTYAVDAIMTGEIADLELLKERAKIAHSVLPKAQVAIDAGVTLAGSAREAIGATAVAASSGAAADITSTTNQWRTTGSEPSLHD